MRISDWSSDVCSSDLRMREWRELHRQLKLQCEDSWGRGGLGLPPREAAAVAGQDPPCGHVELHRALIAGLHTQLGHRTERGQYEGPRGRKFQLFPGSPLASKPPPWVLSATLLDTEKVWSLTNAAIEPEWAMAELP